MGLELFNTLILSLLVVVAVALWVRDLVVSAVIFAIYGFLMCLLWAETLQ